MVVLARPTTRGERRVAKATLLATELLLLVALAPLSLAVLDTARQGMTVLPGETLPGSWLERGGPLLADVLMCLVAAAMAAAAVGVVSPRPPREPEPDPEPTTPNCPPT